MYSVVRRVQPMQFKRTCLEHPCRRLTKREKITTFGLCAKRNSNSRTVRSHLLHASKRDKLHRAPKRHCVGALCIEVSNDVVVLCLRERALTLYQHGSALRKQEGEQTGRYASI